MGPISIYIILYIIEFIWVWEFPLNCHHKMIPSQIHFFRDPFLTPKRFPGQNVDLRSTNLILGSKIRPQAWTHKRCALKNHAESSIWNCKRSHIAQVMVKKHVEGSLQNLGICVKKGNPVFKKGNPASKGQGWPSGDLRGTCCFSIAKINIFEKRDRLACTRRAWHRLWLHIHGVWWWRRARDGLGQDQ